MWQLQIQTATYYAKRSAAERSGAARSGAEASEASQRRAKRSGAERSEPFSLVVENFYENFFLRPAEIYGIFTAAV